MATLDLYFQGHDRVSRVANEVQSVLGAVGIAAAGFAVFNTAARAVDGLTDAMGDLVKAGFAQNAQIQRQQVAYQALIKDVQLADQTVRELVEFANVTPFTSAGILGLGRDMLLAKANVDELLPSIKAVGDILAITGRLSAENLDRVSLALQQVGAAGHLTGEEARQLRNAGIPALQAVSHAYGITEQKSRDLMMQGRITTDVLLYSLRKFAQDNAADAMAKDIERMSGALEALRSNLITASADGLKPFFDELQNIVVAMAKFTQSDDFRLGVMKITAASAELAKFIKEDLTPAWDNLRASFANTDWATAIGAAVGVANLEIKNMLVYLALIPNTLDAIGKKGLVGTLFAGLDAAAEGKTIANQLQAQFDAIEAQSLDRAAKVRAAINRVTTVPPRQPVGGIGDKPELGGMTEEEMERRNREIIQWNRAVEDIQEAHNKNIADYYRRNRDISEDHFRKDAEIRRRAIQGIEEANRDEAIAGEKTGREIIKIRAETEERILELGTQRRDRLAEIDRDEAQRNEDFEQRRRDAHQKTVDALVDMEQRYADRRAEIMEDGDNSPRGRIRQEQELKKLARQEARERLGLTSRLSREEAQAKAAIDLDQRTEQAKTAIARAEVIKRANDEIAEAARARDENIAERKRDEAERIEEYRRNLARITEEANRDIAENFRVTQEKQVESVRRITEEIEASKKRTERLLEDNDKLFKSEQARTLMAERWADAQERGAKAVGLSVDQYNKLPANSELRNKFGAMMVGSGGSPVEAAPPSNPLHVLPVNNEESMGKFAKMIGDAVRNGLMPASGGGGDKPAAPTIVIQSMTVQAPSDPAQAVNEFVDNLARISHRGQAGN